LRRRPMLLLCSRHLHTFMSIALVALESDDTIWAQE
jgi:hypothetical protein